MLPLLLLRYCVIALLRYCVFAYLRICTNVDFCVQDEIVRLYAQLASFKHCTIRSAALMQSSSGATSARRRRFVPGLWPLASALAR